MAYYGSYCFDRVHPLQAGVLRRKCRATRRPGSKADSALGFYVRHAWNTLSANFRRGLYWLWLERIRKRVQHDPADDAYTDAAIGSQAVDAPADGMALDDAA